MQEKKYFNRELSWIEFNARVLHEACRPEVPLLERLNFIAIVSSNFDEFFQVRVASIKRMLSNSPHEADYSGLTPAQLLQKISRRAHEVTELQHSTLKNEILPQLEKEGIQYVRGSQLTAEQKSCTDHFFKHEIFPLLTPLRADEPQLPQIINQHTYAAFLLTPVQGLRKKEKLFASEDEAGGTKEHISLVQVPFNMNRLFWFPQSDSGEPRKFTTIDDIIIHYGPELFPGYTATQTMLFKIDRDADFAVDEASKNNALFIHAMEEVLVKRQSSLAVRMTCNDTSPRLMEFIMQSLSLGEQDIYKTTDIVDPSILREVAEADAPDYMRYPEWKSFYPDSLPVDDTYWNTLRQHDVLLNVPYQSYDPVIKFIRDAAVDPQVLAIKMTLYRTGNESPIVQALEEAARNGKQVTALVELKARFDEQRNITQGEELERAGATVIYGLANYKVHSKICIIMRKESEGVRRYVHMSTGNYNPRTARFYQDFSIFTANHLIANDATRFFNVLSGYSILMPMHYLFMAPLTLKSRLLEMIEREIKISTPERPGLIMAKMNSLCHKEIIDALYRASSAGVQILLNVRGICTLIPGNEEFSKNIHVKSIIGRYLEHSRVFYFQNGGEEELYLSSADWMERNLDRRVELMFPVTDPKVFKTVKECLETYFADNVQSHTLMQDGSWQPPSPQDSTPLSAQSEFYQKYKKFNDAKFALPRTEFTVRRKD